MIRPVPETAPTSLAPRLVVAGAGVTGLAAAWHVRRLWREAGLGPLDLRVYEASARPGGLVRTERVGDLLLEAGADSLALQKPAALALCERLGLGEEIVRLEARGPTVQIVRRGRLHDLPEGFALLAPSRLRPLVASRLFSWRGKLRMLAEPLVPARGAGGDEDESLRAFVVRRLGREAFERAAEPIVAGLFTADADRLSLDVALPRFLELERRHGSVIRGLRRAPGRSGASGFAWLREGMEALVTRLGSALGPGTVRLGARIDDLGHDAASGRWQVQPCGAAPFAADAVILATPSFAAARILAARDGVLAQDLGRLDYASCATVHLAYRASQLRRPLAGYGFFVPRRERLGLLACSYVSVKFRDRVPGDHVLLRVFLGGALDPRILERPEDELVARSHTVLSRLLRIEGEPELHRVHLHPHSMPQFEVGDRRRLLAIDQRLENHPGLYLAGSACGAIGIPDSVASGERAAQQAVRFLAALERSARRAVRA